MDEHIIGDLQIEAAANKCCATQSQPPISEPSLLGRYFRLAFCVRSPAHNSAAHNKQMRQSL